MAVEVADPGAVLVARLGAAARPRRGRVSSWPLLIGGALLGVIVLAIVAMLGPSLLNLFIAIWAVGWVSYARIIRGETLVARQQEYVLAARVLGYSDLRIMVRHILPNVFSAALIFSMV